MNTIRQLAVNNALEADVCQPLNFDQDSCQNGTLPPWKPTMGLGFSRSINISSQLQ